ncbi:hypothetical protein GCM10007939_24860 [Amylibacter marinus]|uniref:Transposase n=1 Tax=Amylibacter marinus TaxID=1475483 RepID=A0ABQ5VY72_9RHOB|nr:hypothetical protein GCM10007939_24860 [Amylibacter marinus]
MKRRFTDEQIISILKEQEVGERTADLCRRHRTSEATLYKSKAKCGGIEPSDARKLKALESCNARPRDELLNGEICYTLKEAQIIIENGGISTTQKAPTAHWDTNHQRQKASC